MTRVTPGIYVGPSMNAVCYKQWKIIREYNVTRNFGIHNSINQNRPNFVAPVIYPSKASSQIVCNFAFHNLCLYITGYHLYLM